MRHPVAAFDPSALAVQLAATLSRALPASAGVRVGTAGADVLTVTHGGTRVEVRLSSFAEAAPSMSAEEAETAVRAVLGTVADVVSEALTEPWPAAGADGKASAGGGLTAWYGEPESPAIDLGTLLEAPA